MGCQKLPEDEWLGARQLLLQVHSPVPLIYPRACGENLPSRSRSIIGSGSSPRIRGTQLRTPNGHTSCMAHPRAYGERSVGEQYSSGLTGSPPRIGGTRLEPTKALAGFRLTPAHTGNAVSVHLARRGKRAHPRAYGERDAPPLGDTHQGGSPLRIRGTHLTTKHNA